MEPDILASLVSLDRDCSETLVIQLYRAIWTAVAEGRLKAGETLPSSRRAAALLAVSRNTVNAAYDLLLAEGVISVRKGASPRVETLQNVAMPRVTSDVRLSARAQGAQTPIRRGLSEGALAPGSPDPQLFPADAWGRVLRRTARHRQDGADGYAHYGGLPELRRVLADQLHRHRGLLTDPTDIVITPGTQASLLLAAATFADPGDTALIESPGYSGARGAFQAAGLICRGLPVDAQGANTAAADLRNARLIYCTPSTQYPTGVRMTLARRLDLSKAATAAGAVIVEDDYDTEFVWQGRGMAALAALPGADNVVYLGSAAKSLLPGLRIGWLVAPRGLADPVRAVQARLGLSANVHAQAALAEFMSEGNYRAHLSAVAGCYRDRLNLLTEALRLALGTRVQLFVPSGGLQLVIGLPAEADSAALRDRLNADGFAVAALPDYCIGLARQGLVAGFGKVDARLAGNFATALAALLPAQ